MHYLEINVREYRIGKQKGTIRGNWQYRIHKTKKNQTKTQRNVLDITIRNQTQITYIRHTPSFK